MITFTLDQLYGWITAFLWPFARLVALMGAAPMFGELTSPTLAKVGLAAVLAVIVAPTLPPIPVMAPGSYAGLWILAQQIFIGTTMGFVMRICFSAVQTAGDFVGLQMGLSLATLYDPTTRANTEIMASMFNVIAMLVFVTVNGHLMLLSALMKTFTILPIGGITLHAEGWNAIAELGSQIFSSGLLLALPLIAALLTINLALGILNRAAPQLSAFSVGFPITLTVGVLLLTVILPQTPSFLNGLFQDMLQGMERIAESFAGI
jgi:flagellar biosynthetic protein FliR